MQDQNLHLKRIYYFCSKYTSRPIYGVFLKFKFSHRQLFELSIFGRHRLSVKKFNDKLSASYFCKEQLIPFKKKNGVYLMRLNWSWDNQVQVNCGRASKCNLNERFYKSYDFWCLKLPKLSGIGRKKITHYFSTCHLQPCLLGNSYVTILNSK
jgi:hypothetical protein